VMHLDYLSLVCTHHQLATGSCLCRLVACHTYNDPPCCMPGWPTGTHMWYLQCRFHCSIVSFVCRRHQWHGCRVDSLQPGTQAILLQLNFAQPNNLLQRVVPIDQAQ